MLTRKVALLSLTAHLSKLIRILVFYQSVLNACPMYQYQIESNLHACFERRRVGSSFQSQLSSFISSLCF